MKSYNNLIDRITDFDNLHAAYLKARRGKRYSPDVLSFGANLEEELFSLRQELRQEEYATGEYRVFRIYEPKEREIAALPFRDRVVHHALCTVIEPLFERTFIGDSYACRPGKGTHAASDRLTQFLRRAQRAWGKGYCLKADIAKYFQSISHERLKLVIRKTIRCAPTLRLIDNIIDSAGKKGLPIGNLTSQLFANVYLSAMDHFIKESLRIRFYVRYMDDFIILHRDKGILREWKERIGAFLGVMGLSFNAKTSIFPTTQGVDFVGYRTWSTHKLLKKRSIMGMRRKMKALAKQYRENHVSLSRIQMVIQSWLGHARHADSKRITSSLMWGTTFQRGGTW